MREPAARWRAAVAGWCLCAQIAAAVMPAISAAQTSSTPASGQRPAVQRGQEYYEQSRFDEAITLLKELVDRGALSGEDLQKARELLARSYVKKGYPVQAKEMFKAILRNDPNWRPDPIRVPPDETALFEQALKEYQEEKPSAPPTQAKPAPTQPTTPAPSSPPPASQIGIQSEKKPLMKQWWFWALGVGALAGVAAAAGGGGGGGESPPASTALEYFPGTP